MKIDWELAEATVIGIILAYTLALGFIDLARKLFSVLFE